MGVNMNRILTGASGNVWLNNKLLATLTAIELKVTGNFEEKNFCGDAATYNKYNGWSGEGTITMSKVDSTVLDLVGDSFKTGQFPEIKVTTKLTDKVTGQSERVSVSDILITEFLLAKFSAKELIEEELPIKFSNYDILEKIA